MRKRRTVIVIPFLLLGAIINVAVAWMDAVQAQHWAKRIAPSAFLTLDKAIRSGHPHSVRTESLRGWPWPSLRHSEAIRDARAVDTGQFGLPCEIIPTGFAIDTIFYAAILWLPSAMIGVARRRVHHGRCTSCGYDLRGRGTDHKLCPECGLAVSSHDKSAEKADNYIIAIMIHSSDSQTHRLVTP